MSEIKPKKERRFLKTLGRVGEILVEQVLLKLGSSIIRKIGGKKTLPSILFIFLSLSLFAQFPNTLNKQRLGFQTTGDGLTWRGSISDTATIQPINNQSAWVILDTINLKFYSFDFTSNVWNLIGGSAAFTQPVDSLFFNVGVLTNNVDTAKMRWDSDLATVVLGLNDNVPNELGFKNFWLVKNQTGATITKGSLVYANGTVGASGRITVAKFIANGSIDAKYLLGITAHDLTNGEDGYVISFGKIRQVNTDTFAAGAILYPSPTTAGVWTDVEPVAPNIDMPIGCCINSHANNGTIAIRVASGYKLSELHDVAISSPVDKASLYYSGGLWRDTTAALLVSDTASMLTNYLRTGTAASTYVPLNTESTMNATLNINGNLNMGSGGVISTPILSAGTIIKQGGTSSQFLKANGDVDSSTYLTTGSAASTYLPLTGGTLSGDLGISKSSNSILRLSSADVGSYGKLIFSSNNGSFLNYGASIESSGDGVGIDVGSLNFLTGFGTVRTNRMTITPAGNLSIINSTTIGGTLGVTGATTLSSTLGVTGVTNLSNSLYGINQGLSSNLTISDIIPGNSAPLFTTITTGPSSSETVRFGLNQSLGGGANMFMGGTQGLGGNPTNPNIFFTDSRKAYASIGGIHTSSGTNNQSGHIVFTTTPSLNTIALTERMRIAQDGAITMGGTLGVTGATTLSAPLTVNSSAVFNEAATDSDFRVESQANANMLFVDASTSRVGIGYASPTKTLDVNGELRINTVTATPTSLLGKNGSNVVGEVTTVAQTGLMTRGETTATTGSPSATFTVTHELGATPTSILVTSAGLAGAEKIIFEVYTKNSTTFSVQAWNYDGTEAASKSVKIFWLAIK